MDLKMAQK